MITEILTPDIAVTWLPWAVSYFFFIGLSLTAVFLTLPAILFGQKQLLGMAHVAMLVVLTCAIVGPVALLADLHQPARFWHFYTHLTPWSWMSIGAVALPIYVVSTIIYSWVFLVADLLAEPKQGSLWLKPVAVITLILALIIAIYTGSEVAILSSRVLWNSHVLPFFFFVTALLGASSLSLLIAYLIRENNTTLVALSRISRWVALLSLAVVGIWFGLASLINGSEASALTQLQHSPYWQYNLLLLLALLMLTVVFSQGASKWSLLSALSGLAVSWFARWLVFMDGQTIPKYGAGFYSYELPLGTDGLLGILGMLGLWLFLAVALYELFPWSNKTESHN